MCIIIDINDSLHGGFRIHLTAGHGKGRGCRKECKQARNAVMADEHLPGLYAHGMPERVIMDVRTGKEILWDQVHFYEPVYRRINEQKLDLIGTL